ncbi:MAG: hypothetical protein CXZ00_15250 [Acidobacteria bacterium]|nr:MAG: hypothetical protein CXZ00_15250 [Acidobacteriota bacterium]
MTTSFDKDDIKTCFGLDCKNPPEFRLVTLDGEVTYADGQLTEPEVGVTLLCRRCAIDIVEHNLAELDDSIQSDVPTLGFMLLPMRIDPEIAQDLRDEITPELWTDPESDKPV